MTPRSASSRIDRKCSLIPRRWVGDASRRRSRPRSVRTASAPRASARQALRSTSSSSTSRSIRRVTPLLLKITRSASGPIRIRRPGARARVSSVSYSAIDRSCSTRSSSSRRRDTRACASRKARHGDRRGSRAVRGRSTGSEMAILAMLHPRAAIAGRLGHRQLSGSNRKKVVCDQASRRSAKRAATRSPNGRPTSSTQSRPSTSSGADAGPSPPAAEPPGRAPGSGDERQGAALEPGAGHVAGHRPRVALDARTAKPPRQYPSRDDGRCPAVRCPEHVRPVARRPGQAARRRLRGGLRRSGPRLPPPGRPGGRSPRARCLRGDTGRPRCARPPAWRPSSTARTSSTPSIRCWSPIAARSRSDRASQTAPPNRMPSRPGPGPPGSRPPAGSRRPGTVEGGDTFWLRPDLFCIGRTLRTNDGGRPAARRRWSAVTSGSSTCRTGRDRPSSST